jgi:hypothetical protein
VGGTDFGERVMARFSEKSCLTPFISLIRFEFCDIRDAECMDQGFSDLKDAVSKIETRLASTDEKE